MHDGNMHDKMHVGYINCRTCDFQESFFRARDFPKRVFNAFYKLGTVRERYLKWISSLSGILNAYTLMLPAFMIFATFITSSIPYIFTNKYFALTIFT